MDIGEVALQSGLTTSTIRYYEKKGLIESVSRNGLRRQFSSTVVERLALITLGCRAGFTLDEINAMFTEHPGEIDRDLLRDKADELDQKIKELTRMRDGLRHAADCKAPSHFECPKFLKILSLIGKKRGQSTNKLKPRK